MKGKLLVAAKVIKLSVRAILVCELEIGAT
jgi:hypothetical protein